MMSDVYLALMRGINVGGKNKLPMSELQAIFREVGASDVRTYIQSGNVIFRAPEAVANGLPERVLAEITTRFGYRTPVILRKRELIRSLLIDHPFRDLDVPTETLFIMFLAALPSPAAVSTLDLERSPPDRYVVCGREIFLHLPAGVADSKLTNQYFDSRLGTVSTSRNWRTVTKLLEMMEQ